MQSKYSASDKISVIARLKAGQTGKLGDLSVGKNRTGYRVSHIRTLKAIYEGADPASSAEIYAGIDGQETLNLIGMPGPGAELILDVSLYDFLEIVITNNPTDSRLIISGFEHLDEASLGTASEVEIINPVFNGQVLVALDHAGVDGDSVKIGDGTTIAGVTLNNELKVQDADSLAELQTINTALTTLNSTDFSTVAKQDEIIAAINATAGSGGNKYLITTWDVSKSFNGVEEQQWTTSAVGGPAAGLPVTDGFRLQDFEGLPLHENTRDNFQIINQALTTNITGSSPDQSQLDFWLDVPESGADLYSFTNGQGTGAIAISDCSGNRKLIILDNDNTGATSTSIGFVEQGFYRVRIYSHDSGGPSGQHGLRWDLTASANPVTVPILGTLRRRPVIREKLTIYDEDTDTYTHVDGTTLQGTRYLNNPCKDLRLGEVEYELPVFPGAFDVSGTYTTPSNTVSFSVTATSDGMVVSSEGFTKTLLEGQTISFGNSLSKSYLKPITVVENTGSGFIAVETK